METNVNNISVNCTLQNFIKTASYEYRYCMLPYFWW